MLCHPKKKPFQLRRKRVHEGVTVNDEREGRRRQVSLVVHRRRRAHAALVAVGQHCLMTVGTVLQVLLIILIKIAVFKD